MRKTERNGSPSRLFHRSTSVHYGVSPKTHPNHPTTTKRPFSSPRDIPSSPNFCKGPPNHPISRIILSIRTSNPAKPPPLPLPATAAKAAPTMVSLAPFVLKRPWLVKALTPAANWYAGASGYRQLGLRYELAEFKCSLFSFCWRVLSELGNCEDKRKKKEKERGTS